MTQQQQISEVLVACLDHTTVQIATAKLVQLSKSPTFVESLLTLIYQGINNEPVLILALTTYKNFLNEFYNHLTTPMPQTARQFARNTCQQLYFKIQTSSVAVNVYKEILYVLIAVSYPWEGLDLSKVQEIQPNAYIFGQIGHVFEYLLDQPYKGKIENTINTYWPLMEDYVKKILQNYDQKLAKLLHEYLSMFYCATHMELPTYLRNFQKIQLWLIYLKSILNYQFVNNTSDNQNIFLQNQILAAKIMRSFVQQHCRDNQSDDYPGWTNQFISNFIPDIFNTVINILLTRKNQIHEDVLSNIIGTIYSGYKNKYVNPLIKDFANKIMFDEMIPFVDFKDFDLNLFQNDTIEFIRRQEDGTVNPSRWAAIDLINVLIYFDIQGKSMLMKLIEYSAAILKDPNSDMKRKATVMILITKFKTQILKNKTLNEQFGQLVSQYFFPYLSDQNPILVYVSCQLLSVYLISISLDKTIVQQLITKLYDCLNHPCLAVNFMSVLAFTSLLEDDSEAIQYVQPHFSTILKIYLSLIEKLDHQNLLKSLQKMIKFFDKQILSVGPQLIKHLITIFYKYAEKDEEQQQATFSDNPSSAALSTIRQLLDVNLDQSIYFNVSKQITQILAYIVRKNLKDCFEDIYDIFSVLTFKSTQLSDYAFPYLLFRKLIDGVVHQNIIESQYIGIVHSAIKADPSYLETIYSILKNLMIKMPRQLLFSYPLPKTPDLILCLIQNKILTNDQLTALDTSQVSGNWGGILQSYSSIVYGIGSVNQNVDFIKGLPSTISLYPWINTVNDLNCFLAIIRKSMNQIDEDDTESDDQNLTTLQMMQKYAKQQQQCDGSDFEDGAFVDEEASYNYNYNSPFDLKNDFNFIKQKLNQLSSTSTEIGQQLISSLGKNEYAKLEKLMKGTNGQ